MCIAHNTKPCDECPFRRKSLPGWLGQYSIKGILQWFGFQMSFPCHKTMTHNEKGMHFWTPKERHCAGALIMLQKMKEPNMYMQNPKLFSGIEDRPDVFNNFDEFTEHHRKFNKNRE